MWQYIVKRLLLMLPTLIGAALVVFLLMHVVPGDVALLIIGGDQGGDLNPQEWPSYGPSLDSTGRCTCSFFPGSGE
jgi:ABC-type dipeptide/oligopeptide/nickel transport system permease component